MLRKGRRALIAKDVDTQQKVKLFRTHVVCSLRCNVGKAEVYRDGK